MNLKLWDERKNGADFALFLCLETLTKDMVKDAAARTSSCW